MQVLKKLEYMNFMFKFPKVPTSKFKFSQSKLFLSHDGKKK